MRQGPPVASGCGVGWLPASPPAPVWPSVSCPQQLPAPLPVTAQLKLAPSDTAVQPLSTTLTGRARGSVSPAPSWPCLLPPQHQRSPCQPTAQVCASPAATETQPAPPLHPVVTHSPALHTPTEHRAPSGAGWQSPPAQTMQSAAGGSPPPSPEISTTSSWQPEVSASPASASASAAANSAPRAGSSTRRSPATRHRRPARSLRATGALVPFG